MRKPYYESNFASLTYTKSKRLTKLVWKNSVTPEEYQKVYSEALRYNRKNYSRLFLTDMKKLGVLDPEMIKWTISDVMPEAIESGLKRIAMVFEDDLYLNIIAETISKNLIGTPVELKLFEDLEPAQNWLES